MGHSASTAYNLQHNNDQNNMSIFAYDTKGNASALLGGDREGSG